MTCSNLVRKVLTVVAMLSLAFTTVLGQDNLEAIQAGESLFKVQCAQCHNRNMVDNLTGPALGGVQERWAEYPEEDLYRWIRNSQAMIAEGHPRAVEVWNEWKPTVMNNFTNLTDEEISNLLVYINAVYAEGYGRPAATAVTGGDGQIVDESDNTLLYVTLLLILGILAVVLARIVANLNYMAKVQEGTAPAQRRTLVDILTSKGVIGFVIFSLVVLGGYTTVNNAIMLGRQQGYQPEQPIKFSHALHSGTHQIECQYCHDGARRSKHSVIPAANTCMNCHRAIKYGTQYGTAELTKIYASIGYDPRADKYIENYEDLPEEEIEEIYRRWITDQYTEKMGTFDDEGERIVDEQWYNIKASLTNEIKKEIPGPIEWVRIHNLPDHAYFNHAQHVSVGKVECQTCHGPIEEMEIVYQYSPLSMGWCINCHRQTEVQFAENDYYDSYQIYHEQMAAGERDRVTVEDIGGLECQKCHY